MIIKAELNKYRQSPRKVRLLADLAKGKSIEQAIALVSFSGKRASTPMAKLIKSAVANAKHNFNLPEEDLFVKNIRVDEGVTMKRGMPRAFGRSFPIKKRTSRILLELGVKEVKTEEDKEAVEKKKTVKAVAKKKVVKKVAKK